MAKKFAPLNMNLSTRQFNQLTRNITNIYDEAPEATRQAGRDWYPKAHDFATRLGKGDVEKGAGIIAALSPSTAWDRNIDQAKQLHNLRTEHIDQLLGGDRSFLQTKDPRYAALNTQSGENILKAHRIMTGDAHPHDVLAMRVKTGNFYNNIRDPSNSNFVTIDTHAHDLAMNQAALPFKQNRGLSAVGRYNHFADAYFKAADHIGLETANELQAVTWAHWRESRKGKRGGGEPDWSLPTDAH
jgi:hypothetical protein